MGNKYLIVTISLVAGFLLAAAPTFAHVSVKPSEVGVAERVNFSISVPTEEQDPTIEVRLVLPEGLQSVRPNVKPGWNIELIKTGEAEEAVVTEIIWSGGSIPTEQKDEFFFSAQAPAKETSLVWKAYQTYGDGDVVAWENEPKVVQEYTKKNPPKEGEDDHNAPRPYSSTQVINDLSGSNSSSNSNSGNVTVASAQSNNTPIILSVVAILLAAGSFGMQLFKKSKK